MSKPKIVVDPTEPKYNPSIWEWLFGKKSKEFKASNMVLSLPKEMHIEDSFQYPGTNIPLTFETVAFQHFDFTSRKFKSATSYSSLNKLLKEVEELKTEILKGGNQSFNRKEMLVEFADCFMCLIDSAGRAGFDIETISHAIYDKIQINKSRVWKDNGDGTYSHVKPSIGHIYSVQEIHPGTPSHNYRIRHTASDLRVATCYSFDNAKTVCDALNESVRQNITLPGGVQTDSFINTPHLYQTRNNKI